jgi:ceramide glucosyltransferase
MPDALLAAICLVSLLAHAFSVAVAMHRCRPKRAAAPPPVAAPKIAILRPVCGVDTFEALTLRSTFKLDYPNLQLIFCCDRASDPAALLVEALMREFPKVDAKLLIGRKPITQNPKLNNLLKGWPHVDADWLIMADSNLELPQDYVQRLLAAWKPTTGIVCSPPIGSVPAGFWAEIECAFLNGYQARWQYAADSLGWGFAQGKSMMVRHRDLATAGGLLALGAEVAEDAAATKLVRAMGLKAELVDAPFSQPLGVRSARAVWDRQARWARLRRVTFPAVFVLEILSTSLAPLVAAAMLAERLDVPAIPVVMAIAVYWYGAEVLLALSVDWHRSWRSPFAALVRDVTVPLLWTQAWLGSSFTWRGNEVAADRTLSQIG